MKKLLWTMLSFVAVALVASCSDDDDNWDKYKDWRNDNNSWMSEQAALKENGKNFYDTVRPIYDAGQYILIHWYNNREETKNNLQPYYTSTVDVKYIGYLYNGEAFDSSYTLTANGDSIFRTTLKGVISGWAIALQAMHVGDSVDVIIPYQSAYGITGYGNINPYSNLRFSMKLTDIPGWEIQ